MLILLYFEGGLLSACFILFLLFLCGYSPFMVGLRLASVIFFFCAISLLISLISRAGIKVCYAYDDVHT